MARRKKLDKREKAVNPPPSSLKPETIRGIVIVLFFSFSFLSLLALLDMAGEVGRFLENVLGILFGWLKILVPLAFLLLGLRLIFSHKFVFTPLSYTGLVLFILSLTGIFHLFQKDPFQAIAQNKGGGYIGLILSWPLEKITGIIGAFVILLALFLISLLLLFNTSLERIVGAQNIIFRFFKKSSDYSEKIKDKIQDKAQSIFTKRKIKKAITPSKEIISKSKKEAKQLSILPSKSKKEKLSFNLPLDLLNGKSSLPQAGDIRRNQQKIKETLAQFGIAVEMGEINVGPTVTQYTLKPAQGVKLAQITTLANDLALALAAHPIRIEAPIPGKSWVGIEIPNKSVATVTLKECLESPVFKSSKGSLTLALGKDVSGETFTTDLGKMPHLLIAGATGSGKTTCINAIIVSLLYQNPPFQLKFILVDPKRVEFTVYNDIPHLLTPIVTEVPKTINALRWLVKEMDNRFQILSAVGKRDIETYNQKASEKLPYIVLIIDELADLMSVAAHEVEGAITRLAQMARAVGIHLIVATQRPSVDVITGLIKANITSRIAFAVASATDSRTILDFGGAEKLLGRGDMLYISPQISKPKRLQGAYVADEEIKRIADYLRERSAPDYHPEILEKRVEYPSLSTETWSEEVEEDERLIDQAKEVILQAKRASASLLQRRLKIGYARAARILDILEERGFIGPARGAKPREILIKEEDENSILQNEDQI